MTGKLTPIERFVETTPYQAPEVPVSLQMPLYGVWPETCVGDFRVAADAIDFVRRLKDAGWDLRNDASLSMHARGLALRIEKASS